MNYDTRRRMLIGAVFGVFIAMLALASCGAASSDDGNGGYGEHIGIRKTTFPEDGVTCYVIRTNSNGNAISCVETGDTSGPQ